MCIGALFAGTAFACEPNGLQPVNPVFCNPYQVVPPPSPYVEFNAQTGYGVHVLADGTRITADFGRGTLTILFSNGAIHVANISELDAATQEQFWKAARYAAENPAVAFNLPLDQIPYGIDLANSALAQTKSQDAGASSPTSNCKKPLSEQVLDCIEVKAPILYYSLFTQTWRLALPGEWMEAGTIFCPYGADAGLCLNYLRMHKEDWEKERKESCVMAGFSGGAALFTGAQALPACVAFGASLGTTSTGAGAGAAPVAGGTGLACLFGGGATLFAALIFRHELAACQARYPGPRSP